MSGWEGCAERECGEHRTTGRRAWCFVCTEWCYEHAPCKGCERPILEARVAQLEAAIRRVIDEVEGEGLFTMSEWIRHETGVMP